MSQSIIATNTHVAQSANFSACSLQGQNHTNTSQMFQSISPQGKSQFKQPQVGDKKSSDVTASLSRLKCTIREIAPTRRLIRNFPELSTPSISAGNNVNATGGWLRCVDVVASEVGCVDVAQPSMQPSTMTKGGGQEEG
jgi:hypothetical protein